MKKMKGYAKHIDFMEKREFIRLFSKEHNIEEWFTENERNCFAFPRNSGSLGARYLIKKRICEETGMTGHEPEIEIMNDSFGKPEIKLVGQIISDLEKSGIRQIICSISHSRNYITTMVLFII